MMYSENVFFCFRPIGEINRIFQQHHFFNVLKILIVAVKFDKLHKRMPDV